MKKILFALIVVGLTANICEAKTRRRSYTNTTSSTKYTAVNTSTAQGVAEAMAERNYVGHFGGHSNGNTHEGCGSGSSKEQAYNNCCFASNKSFKTVDVGYAQGKNGRWFCCRRYR